MSKIKLKYLLWIILITLTLVLIPTNKSMAEDIYYSSAEDYSRNNFRTNKDLFCLDHGYPFDIITRSYSPVSDSTVLYKFGNCGNIDVIKYIVTESNFGNWGSKYNTYNYAPQIAIWYLVNSYNGIYGDAANLLYEAYAYADVANRLKTPKVVKEGNYICVYYISSTYYGQTYKNYKLGDYSGINSTPITETYSRDGYTHKDKYVIQSGVSNVNIEITYDNQKRNPNLYLHNGKNITSRKYNYFENGTDSFVLKSEAALNNIINYGYTDQVIPYSHNCYGNSYITYNNTTSTFSYENGGSFSIDPYDAIYNPNTFKDISGICSRCGKRIVASVRYNDLNRDFKNIISWLH